VPLLAGAAGRGLSVGVNMSALQLRDRAFVEQVGAAVTQLALSGSQLVLEMTESIVVADDHETADVLHTLKALGAMLAIDDFGVGFSSIGYLQHLPVDIVKIDRSFTRDLEVNDRAWALVEAILVMGRALEVGVIAEGIERASQTERLQQVGCRTGQGYYYGRPAPLPEVMYLLSSHAGTLHSASATG
jgi:EAL domain-containing protein (putative c-di-GMP-specific phosphodiesterase class I)